MMDVPSIAIGEDRDLAEITSPRYMMTSYLPLDTKIEEVPADAGSARIRKEQVLVSVRPTSQEATVRAIATRKMRRRTLCVIVVNPKAASITNFLWDPLK